jgi:hypothetical protein
MSSNKAWGHRGWVLCACVLAAAATACGGADEDDKRGIGGAEAAAALGTPVARPIGGAPAALATDSRVASCSDIGVAVANVSALQPVTRDTVVVRHCD